MLTVRIPDDLIEDIDRAAVAAGVTRSAITRERLEAVMPLLPPMGADELARVVSQAARRGSVQAMKLRDEQLRRRAESAPPAALPLSELDELASRRSQGQHDDAA